jgi:hypothetical protein
MSIAHDIADEIRRVEARLAAAEAVIAQVTAPLLEAVEPGLAHEVVQVIRAGLNMPVLDEIQRLAAEEYLQRFADTIEARVRLKLSSNR